MAVSLYMDVHVHSAITRGLRLRGIDVLTAQEDGTERYRDSLLLDRAASLHRVIFSNDNDFLKEATKRFQTGKSFNGVIYTHQLRLSIRQCIDDLEVIAQVAHPGDLYNTVLYIPL